jgi:hypothetical protein
VAAAAASLMAAATGGTDTALAAGAAATAATVADAAVATLVRVGEAGRGVVAAGMWWMDQWMGMERKEWKSERGERS